LNLVYLLLLVLAAPWLVWQAVRKGKYREGFAAKFLGRVPRRSGEKTCVWLHAVSVGEVNLLSPLLKRIAQERPDWECVVSTTTMTGMALAKKKYAGLTVFYCPLDFSWAVSAAMRRVRPDALVLAELELWPNLIAAARRHGTRVAVINGRLSEHSFTGYRRIRPLVARVLRQIDVIAAQDETYARRFCELGAEAETVHITGSMKFDGAQTDRSNPNTQRLAALASIRDDDIVFLAGSTQEPEEAVALEVYGQLSPQFPRLRLVIVPRHPDRFDAVARMLESSGLPWQRRSMLDQKAAAVDHKAAAVGRDGAGAAVQLPPQQKSSPLSPLPSPLPPPPSAFRPPPSAFPLPRSPILLVDAVGELGAWWGTATVGFVGGSLGNRGGQNMIEPAAYGAAVCFGPNTRNFRDIVAAMLAAKAAVVVADAEEIACFVRRCLEEPEYATELGRRGQALVVSQLGATGRTLALLANLIEQDRTAPAASRTAA
jgi:3-deoxy-D-manno-octulosonic-acid transferase